MQLSINLRRRFLNENNYEGFDKSALPFHHDISMPAPQVDQELRCTRDHLAKLRFNWHEMKTKSLFLTKLSDADEWRACQTSRWTPGELKQMENVEVFSRKERLKASKSATVELQRRLLQACETICETQEMVQTKQQQAQELLAEYVAEREMLQELTQQLPAATPLRSIEELQTLLDEQSILLEKRAGALERQKNAVADLERLLALHTGENGKLRDSVAELEAQQRALSQQESGAEATLAGLCQWYSQLTETLSTLTGCRVEMVQPDYLLATLTTAGTMVPVHVYVDSGTGKLKSVKIGSTSSTPKRQWRETIETAIEYNDIPFLLRTISIVVGNNAKSN